MSLVLNSANVGSALVVKLHMSGRLPRSQAEGTVTSDSYVALVQARFRVPLMLFLLAALPAVIAGPTLGQDKCDNKIEVEKGEGPGPFFGFEYALYAYALAEKTCGAPVISMSSKVLAAVEKEGCGPDTPMYTLLRDAIRTMEEWDLKALAQEGRTDLEMSQEEVQEWARATADEFGGCSALLDVHNRLQSGFTFGR